MKASQGIFKKTEVVIPIDTIDDIYSDFDLRNLEIRSLSIDFINEVKIQSQHSEHDSRIEIKILAPKSIRKKELPLKIEKLTRRRIKEYFEDEYYELLYERRRSVIKSFIFITSGLLCFFIIKIISRYEIENIFLNTFYDLIIFFSWFATWYGIESTEKIIRKKKLNHIKKIWESEIKFRFIKSFEAAEAEIFSQT